MPTNFTWNSLEQRVHECTKCELAATCTQKVYGTGAQDARVVVVSEAPGVEEDLKGKPLLGKSGSYLKKQLHKAGFRKGDLYITYIVRCRPPNNRAPTNGEAGTCFMWLYHMLELIDAKYVIAVGSVAYSQLVTNCKKKLGGARGDFIPSMGRIVIPTWHPSYVQRSFNELTEKELLKDLKKVFAHAFPERL